MAARCGAPTFSEIHRRLSAKGRRLKERASNEGSKLNGEQVAGASGKGEMFAGE